MKLSELKERFGSRRPKPATVELVISLDPSGLSRKELIAVTKTRQEAAARVAQAQAEEAEDRTLKARCAEAVRTALSRPGPALPPLNPDALEAARYALGDRHVSRQSWHNDERFDLEVVKFHSGYQQQSWPEQAEVFIGWDPGATSRPGLASWHRECLGRLCEGARIPEEFLVCYRPRTGERCPWIAFVEG